MQAIVFHLIIFICSLDEQAEIEEREYIAQYRAIEYICPKCSRIYYSPD